MPNPVSPPARPLDSPSVLQPSSLKPSPRPPSNTYPCFLWLGRVGQTPSLTLQRQLCGSSVGPQGGGVRLGRRWGGAGCGPVLTISVLWRLRGPLLPEVPPVDSLGSKRRGLTNRTGHQPLPTPGCWGCTWGHTGSGAEEGPRVAELRDCKIPSEGAASGLRVHRKGLFSWQCALPLLSLGCGPEGSPRGNDAEGRRTAWEVGGKWGGEPAEHPGVWRIYHFWAGVGAPLLALDSQGPSWPWSYLQWKLLSPCFSLQLDCEPLRTENADIHLVAQGLACR